MGATLGGRLRLEDLAHFVGRRAELDRLLELVRDDPPFRVALVHGVGGIGKSTLVRAFTRKAVELGWTPVEVDARRVAPDPGAFDGATEALGAARRPLLIVENAEAAEQLTTWLRTTLLPKLPADAIAVIVSRHRPGLGWSTDGWEHLATEVPVGPLPDVAAVQLLVDRGVADEQRAPLLRWAAGSPLALAVAADAVCRGVAVPDGDSRRDRGANDVLDRLSRRLVESELGGQHDEALVVAAFARSTTMAVLAAGLPNIDVSASYAWLRARSFAEPGPDGVAVHELVSSVARATLTRRRPALVADVQCRLADHYAALGRRGDRAAIADLAYLVNDPTLQWGFGSGGGGFWIDHPCASDGAAIADALRLVGSGTGSATVASYLDASPEHVSIVRDADGAVAGFTIHMTTADAPAVARADPGLRPWLDHAEAAERAASGGRAVLWHSAVNLIPGGDPRVQGLFGLAGILRSGLSNPRWAYLPIDPRLTPAVAFAVAAGARLVPELGVRRDGDELDCYVIDWGQTGLLGAQSEAVYQQAGRSGVRRSEVTAAAVHGALRVLDEAQRLATCELASVLLDPGGNVAERADELRRRIERAVVAAFCRGADDELLGRLVTLAFVTPIGGHDPAARSLHLSRATYFRRLRVAEERLADYLSLAG